MEVKMKHPLSAGALVSDASDWSRSEFIWLCQSAVFGRYPFPKESVLELLRYAHFSWDGPEEGQKAMAAVLEKYGYIEQAEKYRRLYDDFRELSDREVDLYRETRDLLIDGLLPEGNTEWTRE